MMYPIGLSTNGDRINRDVLASYQRAGISAVEISGSEHHFLKQSPAAVRTLAADHGITLWSFHLPFVPFDQIDISMPSLAKTTLEKHVESIKRAVEFGIKVFVIHPSGEPICDKRDERIACAKEHLSLLAEEAEREGAVIAVEDIPRTCLCNTIDETLDIVSADDRLRVCFDTNHLIHGDKPEAFAERLGDRIVTLHVSDYDFKNERHWLPGEGKIDWHALVTALKAIDYRGPWMFEINRQCPPTLIRDRELTPEDFVRSANEVFAGNGFTTFSRPVDKDVLDRWDAQFVFRV